MSKPDNSNLALSSADLEMMLQDAKDTGIHEVSDERMADAAASIGLVMNRDAQSSSPQLNEEALKNYPLLVGFKALISELEGISVDLQMLKIHELDLKRRELEIEQQKVRALEQLANNDASNANAVREILSATADIHLEMRSMLHSLDHYIRKVHPDNSKGSNHE